MMNMIWAGLCLAGLCWGMAAARSALLTEAVLAAMRDAISLAMKLAGGFALWSGMLHIVEKSGAIRGLTRILSPALSKLFPDVTDENPAREAMAMNMAANMLGLGNAATPMGLRAVRLLSEQRSGEAAATDAICMFLVINASSLQLFPTTVIALRAAAGSVSPTSILLPTLASTAISTGAGIAACLLLSKWGRRHG